MPRLPRSRLGPGAIVGFAGVAWIGMYLFSRLQPAFPRPRIGPLEWLIVGAGIVLAAHVVLVIHEVGHLLGGWLAGYRLRELAVGPLRIVSDEGRLHIVANRRLSDYGGLVRMVPGRAEESRIRTAILLAAGPAASLLIGAAITAVGIAATSDAGIGRAVFSDWLANRLMAVAGVGSVVVGLANLIPVSFSDRRSDGAELWARLTEGKHVVVHDVR